MLRALAEMSRGKRPSLHANLSGMQPQAPRIVNSGFEPESTAKISQSGAETAKNVDPSAQSVDHHCQICPTCGHRLSGHRCKLVCANCGYYMSCADYY